MDLALRPQPSHLAASNKTMEPYTLETVYKEAMEEVKALHASGMLPDGYYNSIMRTKRPEDLHHIVEEENKRRVRGQTRAQRYLKTIVSSTVKKLERYADAIDMIAQSSPQALGLNIVGLLWGSLKFLVIIALDIATSLEMIDQTLHDLEKSLPILANLTKLYGMSEIQLLRQPLVDIYASIVSLGLVVIRLCERGPLRALGRSVWDSLQGDLNASIARLEKAGKLVEKAAHVEHMHATKIIGTEQEREIHRQERFRREVRSHWTQPRTDGIKSKAVPINDAPLGILTAHFTGRRSELVEIGSILTPRPDNLPARCAIVGMPGLGKTQLALKYSLEVFDQARGPMIFWTSAATPEKLAQGLCKILDIVEHADKDHMDQHVRLSAVQRWLEGAGDSSSLPWLLVLDNVNEESVPFLREHLPRASGHGAILFTMHSVDVASALINRDLNQAILELEVLSPADASNLLLAELQASNPDKTASQIVKAERLVKCVGRLPLAIGHVASFANQHLKGLDYILRLFEDQHAMEVLSWDNNLSRYEQRSVMITFSSKLDELAAASPVISLLLQMLSLFDPESIALDMIKRGAYPTRDLKAYSEQRRPKWSEPPMPAPKGTSHQLQRRLMQKFRAKLRHRAGRSSRINAASGFIETSASNSQDGDIGDSRALMISKLLDDPLEYPKAIQVLRKSSFVSHQCSDDGEDIRIHDLVRSMIRHRARQSKCDSLCFRMAAATVDYAFDAIENPWNSEFWPLFERGLPHYRSLVAVHIEQQGCNIDLARACYAIATYLLFRGRTGEAIKMLREMLPLQEKYHGVNNLDYIRELRELGAFLDAERNPNAESIMGQSLILIREAVGDTHLDTLRQKTRLARFYSAQGRHNKALALVKMVVDTMKLRFGTEHANTLSNEHELAGIYVTSGRYMEAELLYEEILDTADRVCGKDNILTWSILLNLGKLKFDLYKIDAAVPLLSRADARERRLFRNSRRSAYLRIRSYIGHLRRFQGLYLEAESILKEVLTGYETSIGWDHVVTIKPTKDLAWLYIDMERFEDAEVLFSRVVEISEREPESDYGLDRTLAALAFVAEQQGRAGEAETMYRRVLDQNEQWPGTEILRAAPLSRLLSAQGRTEEAQLLYETALDNLEKWLLWLYRNGIYCTQDMWSEFTTIGQVFRDEKMSKIALRVQEEKIGLSHPVTQRTVQALLRILHEKGKTDQEEALLQRCKDAGVDVPLYLENEEPESQAGAGEGDNTGQTEETVVTGEASEEEAVRDDLASTPGRSAKSLGKRRAI